MTESEKKNEPVLPEPPVYYAFYTYEPVTEETLHEIEDQTKMPLEPEVKLGNTKSKVNSSGLIILYPQKTQRYFLLLDKMNFRVDTGVSIRIPSGFVANIQPIEYNYNNRFVLPKTINNLYRTEFTKVVIDLLIYRDDDNVECVIDEEFPVASLHFTRMIEPRYL